MAGKRQVFLKVQADMPKQTRVLAEAGSALFSTTYIRFLTPVLRYVYLFLMLLVVSSVPLYYLYDIY